MATEQSGGNWPARRKDTIRESAVNFMEVEVRTQRGVTVPVVECMPDGRCVLYLPPDRYSNEQLVEMNRVMNPSAYAEADAYVRDCIKRYGHAHEGSPEDG